MLVFLCVYVEHKMHNLLVNHLTHGSELWSWIVFWLLSWIYVSVSFVLSPFLLSFFSSVPFQCCLPAFNHDTGMVEIFQTEVATAKGKWKKKTACLKLYYQTLQDLKKFMWGNMCSLEKMSFISLSSWKYDIIRTYAFRIQFTKKSGTKNLSMHLYYNSILNMIVVPILWDVY